MIQQVNLYTEELKPRREPVQAVTAALVIAVALGLVCVAAIYTRMNQAHLQRQLADVTAVNQGLNDQVDRMAETIKTQQVDPQMVQDLSGVTANIERRKRLLMEVEKLVGTSQHGFSPFMTALARQAPDGLWLTGFGIDLSQDQVQISGSTRTASKVPLYLQHLGDEPAFSGRSFGHLNLQRDESEAWLDFTVATRQPSEKGS